MSLELESMWDAMKGIHYQRTIEQLELSISRTKHLEEALTVALNMVVDAVHAVAGTFWYYDQFGDGLIRPKAVYGGADLSGISLLPGEGIAGQVIQSGQSVIIADCQKDPRWAGKTDAKTGFRTESMICVPLKLNDALVFGSIQIINKTDGVGFDEKDLAFAEHLAGATSNLFRRQGLLDDYIAEADLGKRAAREEVSFMQIVGAEDEREMERQLRRIEAYAALRVADQEAVLKLVRELRGFFGERQRRAKRRLSFFD